MQAQCLQKIWRKRQVDGLNRELAGLEARECSNLNKLKGLKPPEITLEIERSYKCEIEVHTKYGMTEDVARLREYLRDSETKRHAEEERQKRCLQAPPGKIGMTPEEVIGSQWGYPSDRHTTTTAAHRSEQWVYESGPECRPTIAAPSQ